MQEYNGQVVPFTESSDSLSIEAVDSAPVKEYTGQVIPFDHVKEYSGFDYAKGFVTSGVNTMLGGMAAGGQVIQKAMSDPVKIIGSYLGINERPDTSDTAWKQVIDRGMNAPQNIPGAQIVTDALKNEEPGAKQFEQDFEHLMNYLRTKSDKFAQNIPGIKQLYALNPNLGYTLATTAPDVLLTLSMALGMGKAGVAKSVSEAKGLDAAKTIVDSMKQKETPKPTEAIATGSQMEFPGMGEEQMQRAPQYGSQEAGGFRGVDENGHPFDPTRTQEMADTLGGDPLSKFTNNADQHLRMAAREASKEDLLRQAEAESVRPYIDPIKALEDKKLQEEISWAQHEAAQRRESIQRQLELTPETSIREAFKKSIGIEGDYTSLLHSIGDKEMRPEFLDRILRGIKTMPDDQLRHLEAELKKKADTISFEDNSPASVKAIEQYHNALGEMTKRLNDAQKNVTIAERNYPKPGTTVDFILDRGTGHEVKYTGKVVKWGDPNHLYVRDNLTEKIHQLDGHEVDRVYTGPTGIVKLHSFSPKMGREDANFISDILWGAARIKPQEVIDGLKQALPEGSQTADIMAGAIMSNMANAHWRSHNRAIYALNTNRAMSSLLSAWHDNQLRNYLAEEHSLNYESVKKANETFLEHYNLTSVAPGFLPGSTPKYNSFIRDIDVILGAEREVETWYTKGGDWYPSDAYLISKGMDSKSIPVWRNIFEVEGQMLERVNEALVNDGRPRIPRRPGYIHHSWTGPYRVEMFKSIYDKEGNLVREDFLGKIGQFSAKKRDLAYEAIKKLAGDESIELRKVDPTAEGTNYAGYIEDYQKMLSKFESSPGLKKIVSNLYGNAVKGIITESMSRKDIAVVGHSLERATWDRNSVLGLTNTELRAAMDMFRRHFEDVNGFYVRSKYVRDILLPLMETEYLKKWPNLERQVTKAALQFLQIPDGVNGAMTVALRDIAIFFGKDPAIATDIINAGTKGIAMAYLMFRLPYYLANLGQRSNSAFYLKTIKLQQEAIGATTGDIGLAYKNAFKDYSGFEELSAENTKLVPYLREGIKRGHVDPGFNEMITPGKIRDPIAMAIERRNRAGPYVVAYNYAKQFMTEERAIEWAGKHADAIGVPYHPQFGPQLMLQNLDPVMKPITMFTNYSSHIMSMQNNMVYTASSLAKGGDIKQAIKVISQLAGWQLTAATLFGVNAINGMGNLQDIITWYNHQMDTDVPTPQDLALKMNKYLPEFMRGIPSFGITSSLIGYNVSGSGSGVNAQLPTAGVNAILSAVFHAVLFGKMGLYKFNLSKTPVTNKDLASAMRTSPGATQGFDEYMIKYGGRADKLAMDFVTGKFGKNDTSMEKDPTLKGSPRTQPEAYMRLLQGIKSIRESTGSIAERLTNDEHIKLVNLVSAISQNSKEHKYIQPKDLKTLLEISKQYGPEKLESVIQAVIDSRFVSSLDKNTRKVYESLDSIEKFKFYQKYRDRLKLGMGK